MALNLETGNGSAADAASVNVSLTVTSANLLVARVCMRIANGGTLTGITWNTNQNFIYCGAQQSAGNRRVEIWYLINPTSGTHNAVATFSTGDVYYLHIQGFTGANTVTPLGTFVSSISGPTPISVVVSSNTGDIVLDVACGVIGTWTITDQTEQFNSILNTTSYAGSYKAGSSSVTMGWTDTSSDPILGGVSVNAAGGSAAVTGTAAASITEADVVAGGKILTITLTGDTFIS